MLVLSRKTNESIVISDDVEITLIEIRGDKARIGITAPKSVSVHRREVYDAIKSEGSTKMSTSSSILRHKKTG
jgi:carbon storage regulator